MRLPPFSTLRYPGMACTPDQATSPSEEAFSSQISLAQNVQAVHSVPFIPFNMGGGEPWQFQPETRENPSDAFAGEWSAGFSTLAQRPPPPETPQVIRDALKGIPPSTFAQRPSSPETSSIIETALQGEQLLAMRKRSADHATNRMSMPPQAKLVKKSFIVGTDLLRKVEADPTLIQNIGLAEFARQEGVPKHSLREYVCTDGSLRKAGRDRIAEENGWRFAPIDADFLWKVKVNPGLVRDADGLVDFAERENVKYETLRRYVTADGELRPAANDLLGKEDETLKTTVEDDLLREVKANPSLIPNAGGVAGFAIQRGYFYSVLNNYFNESGSLRKMARDRIAEKDGHRFAPVDTTFLRKVKANPGLVRDAGSLVRFAEKKNFKYVTLRHYVNADGSLRPIGRNRITREDKTVTSEGSQV
ncbi:hypothetical protein [Herbaspirillum sp. SJZ099]|uniref:hypothetical protein n=1 Tax=Herbaspirillum sp. SJZ099 TaxID=2572916 RepID=UPI00119DE377|nr:hypothetical protein [Herbaspirillum sp. SJZ099]TWC69822.1 hypothetical protein FB597_102427 [Herbaspirillum sp. SJZ099]